MCLTWKEGAVWERACCAFSGREGVLCFVWGCVLCLHWPFPTHGVLGYNPWGPRFVYLVARGRSFLPEYGSEIHMTRDGLLEQLHVVPLQLPRESFGQSQPKPN